MLKHAGDLLNKIRNLPSGLDPVAGAAAANLAYKFGWEPLISDLSKLLNFSDLTRKRQQQLKKAASHKGARTKVSWGPDKTTSPDGAWIDIGNSAYPVAGLRVHTTETWATCRWHLKSGQDIGYEPSFQEGFRTALGLNPGHVPISVWKALPWSWMIDWFTDISNVMQANYNILYYTPSKLCRMDRSVTTRTHQAYSPWPDFSVTEGEAIGTVLRRKVLTPTPQVTLKLPFMDNFKLSILGSLAILKLKGR